MSVDPRPEMFRLIWAQFWEGFAVGHPIAREATTGELLALTHGLITAPRVRADRRPLDLEYVQRSGLLGEHEPECLTRWLADLIWLGPDGVLGHLYSDDPDPERHCVEMALLVKWLTVEEPDEEDYDDDMDGF